jgi:hypothetical protein
MDSTDLFLFKSVFARDTYQRTIGTPTGLVRCVFNGVTADEFDPVVRAPDATDIVYVGEFRHIKGAGGLAGILATISASMLRSSPSAYPRELRDCVRDVSRRRGLCQQNASSWAGPPLAAAT